MLHLGGNQFQKSCWPPSPKTFGLPDSSVMCKACAATLLSQILWHQSFNHAFPPCGTQFKQAEKKGPWISWLEETSGVHLPKSHAQWVTLKSNATRRKLFWCKSIHDYLDHMYECFRIKWSTFCRIRTSKNKTKRVELLRFSLKKKCYKTTSVASWNSSSQGRTFTI